MHVRASLPACLSAVGRSSNQSLAAKTVSHRTVCTLTVSKLRRRIRWFNQKRVETFRQIYGDQLHANLSQTQARARQISSNHHSVECCSSLWSFGRVVALFSALCGFLSFWPLCLSTALCSLHTDRSVSEHRSTFGYFVPQKSDCSLLIFSPLISTIFLGHAFSPVLSNLNRPFPT